jgi:hypothetical protein
MDPLGRLVLLLLSVAAFVVPTPPAGAQPLSAALRVPGPEGKMSFGGAVAGRAGKIIVSGGFSVGANVYVIDGASGATLLTITNPSPAPDDWFGAAVAWVGADVLVGAPLADAGGPNRGVAYLFDGATGALLHTLTRPDAVDGWFGFSVAGLGDDALVGSYGPLGPNGAGAYLLDGATGALLRTFGDPNANTPAAGVFGRTVVAGVGRRQGHLQGPDRLTAQRPVATRWPRADPSSSWRCSARMVSM